MRINGVPAEEAYRFHPEQWVNLWLFQYNGSNDVSFYCCSQVWNLAEAIGDYDIDEFVLEPVTEDGEEMSLQQAIDLASQDT